MERNYLESLQEMQKQDQVVRELAHQGESLFAELQDQWNKDTAKETAIEKNERERWEHQLKQSYNKNTEELKKTIDISNDLLYKCSGVKRSKKRWAAEGQRAEHEHIPSIPIPTKQLWDKKNE